VFLVFCLDITPEIPWLPHPQLGNMPHDEVQQEAAAMGFVAPERNTWEPSAPRERFSLLAARLQARLQCQISPEDALGTGLDS
jgi:hypothetical protein